MDRYKYIERAFSEIRADLKDSEMTERHIREKLNFTDSQLTLLGQLLSVDADEDLVRFTRVNHYTNRFLGSEPVYDPKTPREISMSIFLQPKWKEETHERLRARIACTLNEVHFPAHAELISYDHRSYGVEYDNISALIGLLHFRSDKLLHPRDKLSLKTTGVGV